MIRFFNVNNPSVIVFLFLYVLLLNAVLFVYPSSFAIVETHAPFSHFFFQLTDTLFGDNHYVLSIISILLVFVQSLLINNLANNVKLFNNTTYVPAIIYVLLASLFREFLFLTPVLLSALFIILAIGKAVKLYRQNHCFSEIFDMGFLIGVASLFYMPACLLIILLFVALAIMRSFNGREWVTGLAGFFSIYFLTGTFFFMNDELGLFIRQHFVPAKVASAGFHPQTGFYVVAIISGMFVLSATFVFLLNFLKSTIHTRKFLTLMGWTAMLLALCPLIGGGFTLNHFVVLSVPLSIVVSYLFLSIRRVKIANVLHFLWLATVLFFQYHR